MQTSTHSRSRVGMAVAAAFLLSALTPTLAVAADVAVGDSIVFSDGPGNTGGGEFNIDNLANGTGIDFITFCLEKNEFLSFGPYFDVGSITTGAINGGVGGGNPDPISFATAWLYTQFRAGSLSGYVGDETSANDLQKAIWHLEDEGVAFGSLSVQAQGWVTAGITNGTSLGLVRVMNLFDENENRAQDQLVMIPEPETYAMLLAGLGLMGFVARRRQRKLATA